MKGPISFIGKEFTKELVSQYISYDPETGSFVRIKASGNRKAGDRVGTLNVKYLEINICGRKIRGHQLAWLLTHGYIPKTIDHINGNGFDNRMCNLREVTQQQNCQNQRTPPRHNTSGFMGVSYYKAGDKYAAHINLDGKKRHLGYFDDPEIAHNAYLTAKRKLHTSCSI